MKKKLKIAIFCTNEWPTPPPQNTFYAPMWIAYYEAEELAKRGHKVYYFGSKTSKLKHAKLISFGIKAIKYNPDLAQYIKYMNEMVVNFYEQMMISKIYQMDQKENFDIIHIHPYRRCLPFTPLTKTPTVITIHDPIEKFRKYMLSQTKKIPQVKLISLSNNQRNTAPDLNYAATVYNGLDLKKYSFSEKAENFFVSAGRFNPEKGVDLAVQAAIRAKTNLKIAGGPARGNFFENRIKPFLGRKIKYVGMLNYLEMGNFYRKAKALLYPIRWEEPFGLIMIEAQACGVPVIAFDHGSAREVIQDGKTGFIVKNLDEMVQAIKKIDTIKRKDCREWVKNNFTIQKMAESYEKAFYKIKSKSLT